MPDAQAKECCFRSLMATMGAHPTQFHCSTCGRRLRKLCGCDMSSPLFPFPTFITIADNFCGRCGSVVTHPLPEPLPRRNFLHRLLDKLGVAP